MKAYEIMREWDSEAGIVPRSNEDLDIDTPGGLSCADYDDWKERLEAADIDAIIDGRTTWHLPLLI